MFFIKFQIFEKALDEPKYSSMYAQLCHQLCEDAPNFDPSSSSVTVSTYVKTHQTLIPHTLV